MVLFFDFRHRLVRRSSFPLFIYFHETLLVTLCSIYFYSNIINFTATYTRSLTKFTLLLLLTFANSTCAVCCCAATRPRMGTAFIDMLVDRSS